MKEDKCMFHLTKLADKEGNIQCGDIASKNITSIIDLVSVPLCDYHYNRLKDWLDKI